MKMGDRNTFPCRGCGKPFLEESARNIHESSCSLVDSDSIEEREESEESEDQQQDQMEDQDQYRESPPEAPPETPSPVQPDPDPQPPDRKAVDFGDGTCQCCGSDVGNTTRQGLCWGCDLAGCGTESPGCEHREGGSSSA